LSHSTDFDVLTVGHSNLSAECFMELLRGAGVTAIADVRSVPFSRRFPWFSGNALAARLREAGMAYLPLGEVLGGRPRDPALYSNGVADYEKMAATPQFRAGLDEIGQMRGRGLCLTCAEREPLDCHRFLLVGRALAERGFQLGHILIDGTIEPQASVEDRLLALVDGADDLFATRASRLVEAHRQRARKAAAHLRA
jgi:uncharacterized protein (DUF488 family)